MAFAYKNLPYNHGALEPFISEQTMGFHHDRHYKKYVEKLNELVGKFKLSHESLEDLIVKYHGIHDGVFQNAGQVWNHEFYWKCLNPDRMKPSSELVSILGQHFGSLEKFIGDFNVAALNLFGSGWVWVTRNLNGDIKIAALEKADNPLRRGQFPLFVCDVWEHAYYLDCQNDRSKYLHQFWEVANWKFFEQNIRASAVQESEDLITNM